MEIYLQTINIGLSEKVLFTEDPVNKNEYLDMVNYAILRIKYHFLNVTKRYYKVN